MTRRSLRTLRAIAAVIAALVLTDVALFLAPSPRNGATQFGIAFSSAHAEYLGLDPDAVYAALLDDLGVRRVRLGAYWNAVESARGTFDFDALDRLLDASAARDAQVILAVGRRLPRWPECHVPTWAAALPEREQREVLLAYVRTVVGRYKDHPALAAWQVENEPFFRLFGSCAIPERSFFDREVMAVRALDPAHPILVTDSGELSLWWRTGRVGDLLGTTMYRVVWNRFFGYWSYDWLFPPALYRLKAWVAGVPRERMVIAELQAEPWIPGGDLFATPLAEQRRSMDAARLARNVAFTRATGFPVAYLWGAEYWYWLKERRGDPSLWDAARAALTTNP